MPDEGSSLESRATWSDSLRAGDQMEDVVARDPRIEAILTHPDEYFRRARTRAWAEAGRDILAEMERRDSRRSDGHRPTVDGAQRDRADGHHSGS